MAIYDDTEYQRFSASLLRSLAGVIVHISHINTFAETGAIQAVRSLAKALDDIGHAEHTLREWLELGYGRATPEQQQLLANLEWTRPFVAGLTSATDTARD